MDESLQRERQEYEGEDRGGGKQKEEDEDKEEEEHPEIHWQNVQSTAKGNMTEEETKTHF